MKGYCSKGKTTSGRGERRRFEIKRLIEIYGVFLRLGAFTFGGGLAMLPLLLREVNERKAWLGEQKTINLYATAQSAPGIVAVNTSVVVGHDLAGIPGSICALLGQITSPMLVMLLVENLLEWVAESGYGASALVGMRAMVCALLTNTVIDMAKKNIVDRWTAAIAAVVFLAIFLFHAPTIALTLSAGAAGIWIRRRKNHAVDNF